MFTQRLIIQNFKGQLNLFDAMNYKRNRTKN